MSDTYDKICNWCGAKATKVTEELCPECFAHEQDYAKREAILIDL